MNSNRLGREFARNFDATKPLSEQIEAFFNSIKAADPKTAWNYAMLPANETQWEQCWQNYPEIAMKRSKIVLDKGHPYWAKHPIESAYVKERVDQDLIWLPLLVPHNESNP